MIALLLALATQAGTFVLCGESFELAEPLARELAGSGPHLLLDLDGPGIDPLGRSGTEALRPDPAREAELLAGLAHSQAVVLQARTWLSCWKLLQPERKDSRFEQELRAALRSGRTLVATGAAASYCASWALVTRGEIQRPQRNPRREDPNLVTNGLDFARGWMVDSAVQHEASATRLLRASEHFGSARALFLSGPVAWIVRGDEEAEVAGSGRALVFDLEHARRSRGDLREGRLLLLQGGDRLRFEKGLELRAGPATGSEPALREFGLPFEPVRRPGAGFEYSFDWVLQR